VEGVVILVMRAARARALSESFYTNRLSNCLKPPSSVSLIPSVSLTNGLRVDTHIGYVSGELLVIHRQPALG
jgi:hypothetical protein